MTTRNVWFRNLASTWGHSTHLLGSERIVAGRLRCPHKHVLKCVRKVISRKTYFQDYEQVRFLLKNSRWLHQLQNAHFSCCKIDRVRVQYQHVNLKQGQDQPFDDSGIKKSWRRRHGKMVGSAIGRWRGTKPKWCWCSCCLRLRPEENILLDGIRYFHATFARNHRIYSNISILNQLTCSYDFSQP